MDEPTARPRDAFLEWRQELAKTHNLPFAELGRRPELKTFPIPCPCCDAVVPAYMGEDLWHCPSCEHSVGIGADVGDLAKDLRRDLSRVTALRDTRPTDYALLSALLQSSDPKLDLRALGALNDLLVFTPCEGSTARPIDVCLTWRGRLTVAANLPFAITEYGPNVLPILDTLLTDEDPYSREDGDGRPTMAAAMVDAIAAVRAQAEGAPPPEGRTYRLSDEDPYSDEADEDPTDAEDGAGRPDPPPAEADPEDGEPS